MTQQLRHIAVHVTEPSVGDFRWVLTELAPDRSWSDIRSAEDGVSTYRQAMADGLQALQSMVYDLDTGPRRNAEDTKSSALPKPVRPEHRERSSRKVPQHSVDEEEPAKTKGAVFGFGPAM